MGVERAEHRAAPVIDLEDLIRQRQDQLRGRPRDWIDDFGDRRRNTDWLGIVVLIVVPALTLLATAVVVWSLT
jgi:predicted transposase YdaD